MRLLPSRPTLRSAARKPAVIAAAALALMLAAAPLLPDSASDDGTISPVAEPTTTAGTPGGLTPEMQAEIDRVVAAGRTLGTTQGRASLAQEVARCATFEGQRYCLGVGWTTQTPTQVAARLAATTTAPGRERTGDLDATGLLQRSARMSPTRRAAAERAELTMAARSVGKVWLLRHEIQGVPLPAGFAERHPELRVSGRTTVAEYPQDKYAILDEKQVRSQNQTYWCGPATMQAIGWGSQQKRKNQAYWARRLNTTSAGTAITDMVRVVNNQTTYDDETHAGPYVALDIGDFTFQQWYTMVMRHVHDYQAPVVMHPILLKRYFPYLDDDASGHFQVGRGFDQNPDGNPRIGYFEVWDQSKFDPSEPFIQRVQWRNAYRSFRANKDHFQHNIGV